MFHGAGVSVSLLVASSVLAAEAAAQSSDPTATTPPPVATTADPANRRALEGRIDALQQQLTDLDGAIPQQQAVLAASEQTVADFDALLVTNQAAIDANVAAHAAPEAVREELVLSLYTGGSAEQRSFVEFVRSGTYPTEGVVRESLFEAAEEGARAEIAALDAAAEALATERASLDAQHQQAAAIVETNRAQLASTQALRQETADQLDQARAELKALLAISVRSPLNGALDYPIRPAIGVKIDNSIDARPQTGLVKADVVYDIIVEGGITRFLAMYQSQDAPRIGPVRSARTSDISIMAGYNRPIFAYSGGNDGVLAAVRVAPMASQTEASNPRAFVRDEGRLAPYNLYSSTSALYGGADGSSGIPNPQFVFRDPGTASELGRPVSSVTVNIGFETVRYDWNGSSWDRSTNGVPTVDTTAAGQVSPANVVVQFTNYATSPADAQSPDALTVGEGSAWVLTDGKLIEARWARAIAVSPIQYLDASNNQIPLTPGQTWVEMPQPGSATFG